ncbi:GTP cyclohydrolase 1 type 2/Nif3 [Multifurca ochricompacta]|uniref:GTP cyclohydrolase 1 type 2/Nif3 n=1 Tax=Multifurca ochricompacta TaxID=376703 RepID=A0AAD4MCL7_9AGAM|nr:GTP cyclohydrolase 1 type 2/Nif3 [Multifurca ochricompacta]
MSFARYVSKVMDRIAPLTLAETWDNFLLKCATEAPCQNQRATQSILLTVDLTTRVTKEALSLPASMIIAYHPPIFKPLSAITLSNPLQASLLHCAAAGISIYSPHTALDSVYEGINDWLASGLGEGRVDLIGDEHPSRRGGPGRLLKLDEKITMAGLQERAKKHLGLTQLQVALRTDNPNDVHSVAICAGSGGSMLLGVEADVYFTGEMSHHEILAALATGKNVMLCGHTNTERGYLPVLASKLNAEFAKVEDHEKGFGKASIHISQEDRHPLDFV